MMPWHTIWGRAIGSVPAAGWDSRVSSETQGEHIIISSCCRNPGMPAGVLFRVGITKTLTCSMRSRSPHSQILSSLPICLGPAAGMSIISTKSESIKGLLTYMIVFLAFTIGTGTKQALKQQAGLGPESWGGVRCGGVLMARSIPSHSLGSTASQDNSRGSVSDDQYAGLPVMGDACGCWSRPFYGLDSGQNVALAGVVSGTIRSAVVLRCSSPR